MEELLHHLRVAARSLRRHPSFTLIATLTLALGIGANTAIFSVLNGVLLRPLPYAQPDRLVKVWNHWEGSPEADLSPLELFDYKERVGAFSHLGAYATGPTNLTGGDNPERLQAGYLTAGVLPALGVAPLHGRGFTAAEDVPGGEPVVVLGHGLWTRRFGADPSLIGQPILLNGAERVVIGVMPPDFRLPEEIRGEEEADLYMPLGMDRTTVPNRGSHFLTAIARLRPGVTVEQAAAAMAAVGAQLVAEFPDDYPADMRFGATVEPLAEYVVGDVRPVLLILLGAVGLVLLIASVNVASLTLIRADARRREMAVRTALGAGRGRLVRQLLAESGILALIGGTGGVLLAVWATEALVRVSPAGLPRSDAIGVDARVLAFAAGASLLAALLFGLVPALQASRPAPARVLRESSHASTAGAGRQRFRSLLVAVEVALAVVLLVGAGLLVRSFIALQQVDPGFRTEGILTLRLSLPSADYPAEQVPEFYRQLLARVSALPGVTAAGAVTNLPLTSDLGDLGFQIEGRPVAEGDASPRADWQAVTPGYFQAMGMQVLRGRGIAPTDDESAPGAIVINESLAERYWAGEDPIGKRFELGGGAGPGWVTIVGIVRDLRHASLTEAPAPEMYIPHAQFRSWNGGSPARAMTVAVANGANPAALVPAIRQELRRLDPNLPVADVQTMRQVRAESVAEPRFVMLLLGLFSMVALALAAIGVFGMLAYLVTQRTRELGIRIALGASAGEVSRMVVRRGVAISLAGVGAGLLGALATTRLLSGLLFGISATDAATFVAIPLLLLAVALVASYLPARRATRVDPMVALRAD
jgi:putative ABC transport system permease protein